MDTPISLTTLGGGQSIGKSCFLLSVGDQHVLLDCGSFVGKDTKKALPDFTKLPKSVTVNSITAVLISHFHLDHVGGLLYLTEQLKYKGDIYASSPTRAILPLLLRNNRILLSSQAQVQSTVTVDTFANLTKRIREVSAEETIQLNPDLRITAHIAGHVLGAVMWEIVAHGRTILYTGDYSDEEGGFIPAYQLPPKFLRPGALDMLIMECTYGNTDFQSYEERKSMLLTNILTTVKNGGKVLIPSYAIGYAQEIIAFLQEVWDENHLKIPIYFSSQDTKSTLPLFSYYSSWTTHPLSFSSDRVQLFRNDYASSSEPFVLLATHPSMVSGVSKSIFPTLASDSKNMVIFLGQNAPESFAGQIMKENATIGDGTNTPVFCQRKIIPFSAHPDRKANFRLIEKTKPSCVVLVHGDKANCFGFSKYYSKLCSNGPLFLIPENGKTVVFRGRKRRVWIHWKEELQLKRNESMAGIQGQTIKLQKSGSFLELVDSVVVPMSENASKTIPRDSLVHCEYVNNRGLRIWWKESDRDRALSYLQRIKPLLNS